MIKYLPCNFFVKEETGRFYLIVEDSSGRKFRVMEIDRIKSLVEENSNTLSRFEFVEEKHS